MADEKQSGNLRVVFYFPEDVALEELSDRLAALRKTLAEMDKSISPDRKVSYKITKISKESPIELEIAPDVTQDGGVEPQSGINRLVEGVNHVRKHNKPQKGFSLAMLMSMKHLAKGLDGKKSIVLSNGELACLDQEFSLALHDAIGPDTHCWGSYRGMLERMNVHGKSLVCYLYPRLGPDRIKCTFREGLRKSFSEAFDHYVSIYGKMKYKHMEDYPHEIDATEPPIVLESGSVELFRQLKGVAPNCTGDLDASDFIRGLRSDD